MTKDGSLPPLELEEGEYSESELTLQVRATSHQGTIIHSIIVGCTQKYLVSGIVHSLPRWYMLQELQQMDDRQWQDHVLGVTKNSCLQVLEELCTQMQLDGELKLSDDGHKGNFG